MPADIRERGLFARVDANVSPHRQGLSPRDAGRGVLAAHRNARRLFRDALLLLEHGRYASAVSMAILAQEEAAKPITIGMLASEPRPAADEWPLERVRKDFWREFEDHTRKNAMTLDLHSRLGNFPPGVQEVLEKTNLEDMAETFVRLRERCTYVDCVQGTERWSLPENVIDPAEAIDFLRSIRKAIGRVPTPAQVAGLPAKSEVAIRICVPERLEALRAWSETPEAEELSRLDLDEARAWMIEADAALARVMGRAGGAPPTPAALEDK